MAAAAPKLPDTGDWNDFSASGPTSPLVGKPATGSGKKKIVKVWVKRPATMEDIRKTWKPFGLALDPGNDKDLTVKDNKPVPLELGSVDPLEKAVRDEIATLMYNSQQARVEAPLQKHLQKLRAQYATDDVTAQAEAAEKERAAAAAAPAMDAEAKKGMTWAQAKEARAAAEAQTKAQAAGTSGKPAEKEVDRTVVRVSNLVDSISTAEIHRLFGPENGLGRIARLYIAKDREQNRRGFCYITYGSTRDAEKAIAKMHRAAFRNVILLVDYGTVSAGGGGRGGGGGDRGRGGRGGMMPPR